MAEKNKAEIKEHKHLFGSSEKSDFILNMSEENTKKLCGIYCIIAMAMILVAAVPYYFTKNVVDYVQDVNGMEMTHYLCEKAIYWVSTLMIGVGIIGYCVFLIGKMKGEIYLKGNKALLWLVGIIVMSLISALCASDVGVAFTGYFDRAEGILSILGYIGFFAAAMTVTADRWRKAVCDALVAIGGVNSVVGILQSIPAIGSKIPNWFEYLLKGLGSEIGENEKLIDGAIYSAEYTASGFACTPFALGAIIAVIFAVAFSGVVFDKSKLRKILYSVSGILMAVCAVLTDVLPSLIGVGVGAVSVFIMAVVYYARNKKADKETKDKKSEKNSEDDSNAKAENGKAAFVIAVCGVVAAAAAVAILWGAGQLHLKDEKVIFTDCYTRLSITTGWRDDTSEWIYPYIWDDGMYVIENNPLLGTGPDNWGTMYSLGATLDRTYNEYIDVAMQRGIITLALYVIFLLITLKKAFSATAEFIRGKGSWVAAAFTAAACAYIIQAFFNISSISSSPFFWATLGLIWSFTAKGKAKKKR